MFFSPFFNLFRLLFLFLFFLILYPFLKTRSIYFFLHFCGPSFIKLGQILSVRQDLVGDKLADILANFQDNLKPFDEKKVRQILREEFGEKYEEKFQEFDYKTKACASIAQVHKAILVNGEIVAVKILRPKIDLIMQRDIKTLSLICNISSLFSRDLAKFLDNVNLVLKNTAKSELNLIREAENAIKLKNNLKDLEGFYVPKVYIEHSTRKILILQWLDGIGFSDKNSIKKSDFDKKILAKNLVISYFSQVYRDGFFHADMHPGNLFLLKNGDIGVVDFGIMGEINKKTRIAIAEILINYLQKDYEKVAKLHIEAGFVPKDVSLYELKATCAKIGEEIVGNSIKDVRLSFVLKELIAMTKKYKMNADPDLLLLQKTIFVVEGVGIMLDEDLNIWQIAKPWVEDWAMKNLGFDAKIRDFILDLSSAIKRFISK